MHYFPDFTSQTNNVDNKLGDIKDTSTISAVNILLGASNGVRLGAFDDNFINASISGATLNNIDLIEEVTDCVNVFNCWIFHTQFTDKIIHTGSSRFNIRCICVIAGPFSWKYTTNTNHVNCV
jgi:uncharacterized membrane protein YdfJ with MMPL/SSD domain